MIYDIFSYSLFIIFCVYSLYRLNEYRSSKKNNKYREVCTNTIYLVDRDVDHSQSIFKQIVTSNNDAFSRPSLICKYINDTPPNEIINIVINTRGGELVHCEKILKKLLKHKAGYRAYIRNECYSAGAIIALGANEIIMNDDSYIGKIDPQESKAGQLVIWANLQEKYIDSRNIYNVKTAQYTMNYTEKILDMIFPDKTSIIYKKIMEIFVYSELPHCALFDKDQCVEFGLEIREPTLDEYTYFDDNVIIENYKMK